MPLMLMLSAAERALAAELDEGLRSAGYIDLRAAHAHVFVALDVQGGRLTDVAARASITKQGLGELVRYLEHHGYLEIETDSRDRRAKLVRETQRGRLARELSVMLIGENDRRLGERLGDHGLQELRTRIKRIGEGADQTR